MPPGGLGDYAVGPEEHTEVRAGARVNPLTDADPEEGVMKSGFRFTEGASHRAACEPQPGLPGGRRERILFHPERVQPDVRHFSVREDDLAGNCVDEFKLAYLCRADCDVCLPRGLAHDPDR